jgi:hypothetical protein
MKKTIQLKSYPPDGWTPAQWASAERVTEHWHSLPLNPKHWTNFGDYIGRRFFYNEPELTPAIFIGIEKDGYAHS